MGTPGDPVAKSLHSKYKGPRSDPGQETRSHSQINKYFKGQILFYTFLKKLKSSEKSGAQCHRVSKQKLLALSALFAAWEKQITSY